MPKLKLKLVGMNRNWRDGIESSGLELKLVVFKALIETGGVRSMKLFTSRTRLIGVGLVDKTVMLHCNSV